MPRKNLLLVSFLLASSFIWYYATRAVLTQLNQNADAFQNILVSGAYYAGIIVSSLIGALFAKRIMRIRLLRFWMALGCVASVLSLLVQSDWPVGILSALALFLGISFGVGMPSCLAFFAESTGFDKRGVFAGAIFVATNLGAFLLTFLGDSVFSLLVVSLALRVAGFCALLFSVQDSPIVERQNSTGSFKTILQNRTFLLYLVPWLTFCLVDRFERVFFRMFFEQNFFNFMSLMEPVVGTIFVFVGGLLSDRIGRKRVLIYGFVALGVGYAAIGLGPYSDVSRYFYTFVDGIAWGIFMVIYLLVLWGDLSLTRGTAEKYYTLGSIPFFLSDLVVLFFNSYVQGITVAQEYAYAIFSVASFFLFLAVIPLMFAPETLPEKTLKERELKQYVEKAKKTKEKYT
jgi:MFS family permease